MSTTQPSNETATRIPIRSLRQRRRIRHTPSRSSWNHTANDSVSVPRLRNISYSAPPNPTSTSRIVVRC